MREGGSSCHRKTELAHGVRKKAPWDHAAGVVHAVREVRGSEAARPGAEANAEDARALGTESHRAGPAEA